MTEERALMLTSAAVPNPDFNRMPLREKRIWLEDYLAEGKAQIEDGLVTTLETEDDITDLFQSIRAEAYEKAGLKR